MELSTQYLGLKLPSPVVVSASPLTRDADTARQLEEAGAGAIVMHSLFEEQILAEEKQINENLVQGSDSFAEALSYFPDIDNVNRGPVAYLDQIRALKDAVSLPVIASLNGVSAGGWIDYALRIEESGADALELNIYFLPTHVNVTGNEVEQMYVTLVGEIADRVNIPVAVKLSPYFSATPNILKRMDQAGARGLVIFNRFYQPDFDLESMAVHPGISLSTPDELTLRLRWAAILFDQIEGDLAITGGVHSSEDAVKAILAGANVAMMTSAVLKQGPEHLKTVLDGMASWLEKKGYGTVDEARGLLSLKHTAEPAAF